MILFLCLMACCHAEISLFTLCLSECILCVMPVRGQDLALGVLHRADYFSKNYPKVAVGDLSHLEIVIT
jgi:hypothetical protein